MNKNPPDELLEVRRVVPPTIFSFCPEVPERQELLEQTSNNSVLDFCSCECVHAFSAEHSSRRKGRWAMLSQFVFVLKITITQHFPLFDPHEISVLIQLTSRTPTLSKLTGAPLQPNAPPDCVCCTYQSLTGTFLEKTRTCCNSGFSPEEHVN